MVVWHFHLLKNFPQFIVIHTVKAYSVPNEAEVDISFEFSCFSYAPMDVGNLISGSSAFSKFCTSESSQFTYCWRLAWGILTTSNLSWFMHLTFQVPMQYCSWLHQTLLSSPDAYTTGHCFCFGSDFSSLLELFLCSFPLAYWAPTNLGSPSFSVISFCLFILFVVFSRQGWWSGLSFPSPVDYILSELSTMTCPSWVALHDMTHSFIELDKVVIHVISLANFLWW